MALGTTLYGFLGLYLAFRFACLYTQERWALLATLGIWFASSLPVYMYFNSFPMGHAFDSGAGADILEANGAQAGGGGAGQGDDSGKEVFRKSRSPDAANRAKRPKATEGTGVSSRKLSGW